MKKKILTAGFGWFLIVCLSLMTAAAGQLTLAAAAAVILLLLPILTWGLAFSIRSGLEAEVRTAVLSDKNQKKSGILTVQNHTRIPVFHLYAELEAKNALTGECSLSSMHLSVPASGSASETFSLKAEHCGYIRVRVKRLWIMDWLGFLPVAVPCSSSGRMSVLPDTFATQISLELPWHQDQEEESYAPDRKGYDLSEIFQLREYTAGDEVRKIHWKLSGKLDTLIVKDASLPVTRSLLILWDKNTQEASPEEMDAMAEVTASVCQALSQDGVIYTLAWTAGTEIRMEEIQGLDELLQILPQMFKHGADPKKSGVDCWLDQYGQAEYGKVLYFAKRIPEGLEAFTDGQVSAVLCQETADSRFCTISYRPETAAEELQMVVL